MASLLARPAIGRLNDFSSIKMAYIYSVASGLLGLSTILLPMATTNVHFISYFVVYGLVDGTLGSGLSIAVLYSLPERLRPLGFGVFQSMTCVVAACGPALGGKLLTPLSSLSLDDHSFKSFISSKLFNAKR